MSRSAVDPPAELQALLAVNAPRLGVFGARLTYHLEVGSTNDVAAALAARGAPEGTVVVAEAQTTGRGRRGREWFSPPGAGLYLSLVLRPWGRVPGEVPGRVTLMGGVALGRAVRTTTGLPVEIKWPNDVVIGRPMRKLAGILTEASGIGEELQHVILGFGVNLRPAAYPLDVASRATSLEAELGRPVDPMRLLVETLAKLAIHYADLIAGRAADLIEAWRVLAPSSRGAAVEWIEPAGVRRGTTVGVDADGALLVQVGQAVERILGGEVLWI